MIEYTNGTSWTGSTSTELSANDEAFRRLSEGICQAVWSGSVPVSLNYKSVIDRCMIKQWRIEFASSRVHWEAHSTSFLSRIGVVMDDSQMPKQRRRNQWRNARRFSGQGKHFVLAAAQIAFFAKCKLFVCWMISIHSRENDSLLVSCATGGNATTFRSANVDCY